MDPYMTAYTVMLVVGGFFLAVLSFAGHLHIGGGDHDMQVGHAGTDVAVAGHGEVDVHAHAGEHHAGTGHGHEAHDDSSSGFSIMSPFVWSTFIAMSGLGGIVTTKAGLVGAWSTPPAFGSGLVVALATMFGFNVLLDKIEGSSHFSVADSIELEGEVITSIPAAGVGEVAFTAKGARRSGPARSADAVDLPQGTRVAIVRTEGTCLFVRPTTEERLRLLGPAAVRRSTEAVEAVEPESQTPPHVEAEQES